MVSRIPPPEEDDGPRRQPRSSGLLALVLVVAVAAGVWFFSSRDADTGTSVGADGSSTSAPVAPSPTDPAPESPGESAGTESDDADPTTPPDPAEIDPDSGLPTIYLLDLPPEAAVTVAAIERGPPFAYEEDGGTFNNFEGLLPDAERGYYREFTVETPGSDDRGARRIVEGAGGELYWTDDHYRTFARILL